MDSKVKNKNKKSKYILYIIFAVYIIVLFKIVLFKYEPITKIIKGDLGMSFRSSNLIPFKTIGDFFNIAIKENSLLWAFSNIFGNVCIFMPLGYLLPMFFEKFRNIKNTTIAVMFLSIFFELTQYIGYLGSLDIDDVLLNTIGGISGYLVYIGIMKITGDEEKLNKITIILSVFACIIAFAIAREQFGNLLGLTTHEVTTIGQENIPQREPDIIGTYLNLENDKLSMYKGIIAENSSDKEFLNKLNIEINNETKVYNAEIEASERESTIIYKKLSKEEFLNVESYSILKIWYDEKDKSAVDTIEISKKLDTSGNIMTAQVNDKKEINGMVEKINNNTITINLITVQEFEDGSSISVMGRDENSTLIEVEFSDNAKMILNLGKANGDLVERKECSKEDIEITDNVVLKGNKKGDIFIAEEVEIHRIVE